MKMSDLEAPLSRREAFGLALTGIAAALAVSTVIVLLSIAFGR
jgi:hypothetical protein